MAEVPDQIQRRLRYADAHAATLKRQIERFPTDTYKTIAHVESGGLEHVYKVHGLQRIPGNWPFILGDFLHNMRAALDNMAYAFALTKQDPLPPAVETRIAFPVTDSAGDFKNKARNLTADAGQAFRDYAESVQPYGGFDSPHAALFQLARLNNIDKHRKVPVVFLSVVSQDIVIPGPVIKEASYMVGGEVDDGMEVARFTFRQPRTQPYFEPRPKLAVGVPLAGELPLLLDVITAKVAKVIETAPW